MGGGAGRGIGVEEYNLNKSQVQRIRTQEHINTVTMTFFLGLPLYIQTELLS